MRKTAQPAKIARAPASRWWTRSQVTLKLSDRRLEAMARVAESMSAGATPQEAIDYALRVAAESAVAADMGSRLEALEERARMAELAAAARSEELAEKLDELLAIMRFAASDEPFC